MSLERDIIEKITDTFASEDAPRAIEALAIAGKSGRIARCIVFAARGSLDRVKQLIQLADQDYRNVIVAGEYDGWDRHMRDLRVSFLIDEPVKMWIAQVAVALTGRDYTLKSIQTVAVSRNAAQYLSDLGEGTATLEGDCGTLTIVKQNGRWSVNELVEEFERRGLSRQFATEQEFIDAVSGYILSKRRPLGETA
jgi:hypothetical protein